MPPRSTVIAAFDRLIKDLYRGCLTAEKSNSLEENKERAAAERVYELLCAFNWDRDKYISDENYERLKGKYQNDPQRLSIIDFMERRVNEKPGDGISEFSTLVSSQGLTSADEITTKISGLAR